MKLDKTKEQIIDMFEYLIEKGCSELKNCGDCPIYQKYQQIKNDENNSKKWTCIAICNKIYGIKRTNKQMPFKRR